jgi:ribonuclease Z
MHFEVTILGSNGAVAAYDRHPTSQFLNYDGYGYLIDCGEGTQMQMAKYGIKRGKLDHVFISHLHSDHFLGLMGLIASMNLNYREHPLHIYGHPGIEEIVTTHFKHSETQLRYQLIFHRVYADEPRIIFENNVLTVETIILQHRIATTGFLFREKAGLRKILAEKIEKYNIPYQEIHKIKQGADFIGPDGLHVPNAELTTDPAPARSYAFCSDTAYTESFLEQIRGVDVLYHEATFTSEHRERAAETMHSTTQEAATIALKARVGKLLIGHFSARYQDLTPLLFESKDIFPDTELATEGSIFPIGRRD